MTIRKAIVLAALIAASSSAPIATAFAASGNPFLPGGKYEGSSKEQAACRPDVRRYCASIKPGSDSQLFLHCLQANRAKLSKACNEVLTSHGV
jgi:hypothetical protein